VSKADEPLFVIADTSKVWVMGRAYEQNVGRVALGTPVTLRLAAYPERTWPGSIAHIASVLDEKTRTLPIRVELDNPDGLLRPGLFGSLTIASEVGAKTVPVVPEGAVQDVEDRQIVFVPGEKPGEFNAVTVQIAGRDRGRVAISDGLKAGAKVVVSGAFLLKSELLKDQMGEGHAH
jgi:cobalt-zinc-cadmium efflux system membrane fusion protein